VVCYLDWLLDLGFSSRIILSVNVKVLGGGFDLWLGDNIAIFSMVKQAHLLFSNTSIKPLHDAITEQWQTFIDKCQASSSSICYPHFHMAYLFS
jgi:hypothetical protein